MEVDLPGILAYKAQRLAGERPRCRLERLAVDLTDGAARRQFLDRVGDAGPALVVCEGLLVYLSREDVTALSRDLAERPAMRWWLLDLAGPLFLQWGQRTIGRQLAAAHAPFQFAPQEGADFFRPLDWEPVEVRASWEEARRLGREPWPLRLIWALSSPRRREEYRTVSLYVLLDRSAPPAPTGTTRASAGR